MLEPFCWQITEVGKAMEALVSAAGLPLRNVALPQFEPSQRWIESAGSVLGLETEMSRHGEKRSQNSLLSCRFAWRATLTS